MVENSLAGATLERVMKLDSSFLERLQRDHIPYRRDCRACLAGSFRGHIHRRVVAPDAWCLSLDVIGPARQGEDEQLKRVKYGLIATLAVPDVLGKLLQPSEPSEEDDGGGVGPVLEEESPWEDGDQADDEAESPGAAEQARGAKEEEKWKAAVEKEQGEGCEVGGGALLCSSLFQGFGGGARGYEGDPASSAPTWIGGEEGPH